MFKIVKETGGADPALLIMCDASCSNSCVATVPGGTEESPQTHQQFAMDAASQGWLIRLDKQLCPVHHNAERDQRSRIVAPRNFAVRN